MSKDKKIPAWMIQLLLVLMIFAVIAVIYRGKETGTRYLSVQMKPAISSMQLSWKKDPQARSYRIMRYDMTQEIEKEVYDVSKSKYEEAGLISGKERTYVDSDVEPGHCYTYIVQGFRQSDGKGLLTSTSYNPESTDYQYVGLCRPVLLNNGDGENYSNTMKRQYIYVGADYGVPPKGYQMLRKVVGKTGYEKVKLALAEDEHGPFGGGSTLVDKDLVPGEVYRYKLRTSGKDGKKTVYSAWSNVLEIAAVNSTGKYKVKLEDGPVLSITSSDRLNGDLVLEPDLRFSLEGQEGEFNIAVKGFRKDGSGQWQSVPEDGAVLGAGETMELQLKCPEGVTIGAEDNLYAEYNISYRGPVNLGNGFNADLSSGKAEAYPIYD